MKKTVCEIRTRATQKIHFTCITWSRELYREDYQDIVVEFQGKKKKQLQPMKGIASDFFHSRSANDSDWTSLSNSSRKDNWIRSSKRNIHWQEWSSSWLFYLRLFDRLTEESSLTVSFPPVMQSCFTQKLAQLRAQLRPQPPSADHEESIDTQSAEVVSQFSRLPKQSPVIKWGECS